MTIAMYGLKTCDTVRKARAYLEGRGVAYVFHDFKSEGVRPQDLDRWLDAVGWEVLLNRSGTTFRKLDESQKSDLNRDKARAIMLAHPSAIKRPVLDLDGRSMVGFSPAAYEAAGL